MTAVIHLRVLLEEANCRNDSAFVRPSLGVRHGRERLIESGCVRPHVVRRHEAQEDDESKRIELMLLNVG